MYPLWVTNNRYTGEGVFNILGESGMCYIIETGRLLGVHIREHDPTLR